MSAEQVGPDALSSHGTSPVEGCRDGWQKGALQAAYLAGFYGQGGPGDADVEALRCSTAVKLIQETYLLGAVDRVEKRHPPDSSTLSQWARGYRTYLMTYRGHTTCRISSPGCSDPCLGAFEDLEPHTELMRIMARTDSGHRQPVRSFSELARLLRILGPSHT